MPDLFGVLLVDVYHSWQQNKGISNTKSHGVVELLKMDLTKGSKINNSRPITLQWVSVLVTQARLLQYTVTSV